MRRHEVKEIQKIISDYLSKGGIGEAPVNGNTPSPLSPTNSVGSQVYFDLFIICFRFFQYLFGHCSQASGSNTPPCSSVPLQVHGAFQRQNTFFNYLVSCTDLWEQADVLVTKGSHTGSTTTQFFSLFISMTPFLIHTFFFCSLQNSLQLQIMKMGQ